MIPRFVVCSSTPANAAFFAEQPAISPTKTLSACKRYTRIPFLEQLAQSSLKYRSAIGDRLACGESVPDDSSQHLTTDPWWKVIWLTGVDYFQSSAISRVAAAVVAPIASSQSRCRWQSNLK